MRQKSIMNGEKKLPKLQGLVVVQVVVVMKTLKLPFQGF